MSVYEFSCFSDVGRVRNHNEDSVLCRDGLWIVADGMGGYEAGEVASRIAIDSVEDLFFQGSSLEESIRTAHKNILSSSVYGDGKKGMGCTIVALAVVNCHYEIAWVGDSRAYSFDEYLHQLTNDHSFVQQLLDSGAITREEAMVHPQRNVITQALGGEAGSSIRIESVKGTLSNGQCILLCSDGLTGEVTDQDICRVLSGSVSLKTKVKDLIELANQHGGRDNISVVLVQYSDDRADMTSLRSGTLPMRVISGEGWSRKNGWMWGLFFLLLFLLGCVYFLLCAGEQHVPGGGGGSPEQSTIQESEGEVASGVFGSLGNATGTEEIFPSDLSSAESFENDGSLQNVISKNSQGRIAASDYPEKGYPIYEDILDNPLIKRLEFLSKDINASENEF